MGQIPQQPLNYMGPKAASPTGIVPYGRGVFGWVLFIIVAVMLFMLLNKQDAKHAAMPLSEFVERLEEKRIASVVLDTDEIIGKTTDGQPFRTALPPGMGSNWDFVHWVLEKGTGTTTVEVRHTNNVLVNTLLPVVPWLVIFGFIWFFVFRQIRKAAQSAPTPAGFTGPGRWEPDEPGKAGQP
jgi:ATP-dependent Zn protease